MLNPDVGMHGFSQRNKLRLNDKHFRLQVIDHEG